LFKRLFGGNSKPDPKPVETPTPVAPQTRELLRLPESEAEWIPVRAADLLGGDSLLIKAVPGARSHHELRDARTHRQPIGGTGGAVSVQDMSDGQFSHVLFTPPQVVAPELLKRFEGEPFPILLYPQYDGRSDSEEGLFAMHLQPDGAVVGILQPDSYSLYNDLFLNLEFRTGLYAACHARIDPDGVRIDLARYEVCFNRCQHVLHERKAGAIYAD
jgi:hypothetical protein